MQSGEGRIPPCSLELSLLLVPARALTVDCEG